MSEIPIKNKFRGRRKDNNEWAFGNHVHNRVTGKHFIFFSGHKGYGKYEVIPESVGQFTGLLDKSCEEIYEKDKVKTHHKSNLVITFGNGSFWVVTEKEQCGADRLTKAWIHNNHLEVIKE